MTLYIKYIMADSSQDSNTSAEEQDDGPPRLATSQEREAATFATAAARKKQEFLDYIAPQEEFYQHKPLPVVPPVAMTAFLDESKCSGGHWKPKTYYSFGPPESEFRFIILVLGPMGSGKSDIMAYMKAYAKKLKGAALRGAQANWVFEDVNHDHQVTSSPLYKEKFDTIFTSQDGNKKGSAARAAMATAAAAAAAAGGADVHTNQDDEVMANLQARSISYEHIRKINEAYKEVRTGETEAVAAGNAAAKERLEQLKKAAFRNPKKQRRIETAAATAATLQREAHSWAPGTVEAPPIEPASTPIEPTAFKVWKNLRDNIEKGQNIIYEATGEGWSTIKRIFETLVHATNNCKKFKYIVLASINLIDIRQNRERIMRRFIADKEKYDERGGELPVPRIPYIAHKSVLGCHQAIYRTMKRLVNLCMEKKGGGYGQLGQCVGVGIDLLFVFDNRGERVQEEKGAMGTHKQKKQPLFIIPLSRRSKWLFPGQHLQFSERNRKKFNILMDQFAEGGGAVADADGAMAVGQEHLLSARTRSSRRRRRQLADVAPHTYLVNKISIKDWVGHLAGAAGAGGEGGVGNEGEAARVRASRKKKKKAKKKKKGSKKKKRKGGGRGRTRRRRQKYNIVKSTRKKYHRQKKNTSSQKKTLIIHRIFDFNNIRNFLFNVLFILFSLFGKGTAHCPCHHLVPNSD